MHNSSESDLLRTGSYVITVRAQFLYYSQSEGCALLMYQVLEHAVRVKLTARLSSHVCAKETNLLKDSIELII